MLNRPATKIELNMEADLREFEEMKNLRMQNPIEFERIFHTNNILQLLPNYQKDMCLDNTNNNDKKFIVKNLTHINSIFQKEKTLKNLV